MVEHNLFERLHQSEANVRQDLDPKNNTGLIANMDKKHLSKDFLYHRTQQRHQSCRRLSTIPYLIVFYVTLCLASTLHVVVGLENVDNSHQRDNIGHTHKTSTAKKPVTVMWGVADTKATTGMIFTYRIPKDAFKGDVDHFEVTEAGKKTLPRWLNFDNKTNTFIGVPTNKNVGQQYIAVVAKGASSSKAKDVFSINVVEDGEQSSGTTRLKDTDQGSKTIICRPEETLTVVSVIIDVDIDSLNPINSIELLSKMMEVVLIEKELLKVLPLGDKPMYDGSAVMAGPGNAKLPQTTTSVISWQVGCGGNVDADHIPSLTAMESSALDGSMAETLGYPVIGWQVTTTKPPLTKRQKRQLGLMATAIPLPDEFVVPTKYEPNTDTIDTSEAAEDSAVPDSRIIPTMTSPSFPGEKTKHHHHRPEKTWGRHHKHHKTEHITPTKSHPHPKSKSYHLYTPLHTPILIPTHPSRLPIMTVVVSEDDIEITHDYPHYHVTPTLIMPTATPTFVDSRIQPSIQPTATYVTHPDIFTEPTPRIPTRKPKPPKKTTPAPITPRPQPAINHHPVLMNHIDRIDAVLGQMFRFRIPSDTFKDYEDGNSTNLKLVFLSLDGGIPSKFSWVQFNSTTQELYGLPLKDDEINKEYLLAAIDSSGASVRDAFSIRVHKTPPHLKKVRFNHKFTAKLGNNFENFTSDVHNRIHLTEKIASFFGDPDPSLIYVHSITPGSTVFAWSNTSLPTSTCPWEQIHELMDRMIQDGEVSPEFKRALRPEFIVEKADTVPLESCISSVQPTPKTKRPVERPVERPDERPDESPTSTSDNDIYITTVIPAVVIAAMLIIAALIACILYRKKRKGKLSNEDKHTFINKGIPIIFADELEEKPEKPSKSPVILKDEKPPLPPPEYPRSSASSSNPSTPPSDRKEPIETTEDEHDLGDVNTSPPYQPPPPFTTNRENRQSRPKHQPTYRLPPPYVPP